MTITEERAGMDIQTRLHSYATLLVHVQPGLASSYLVETAAALSRSFGARLIGLGAETFEPIVPYEPMSGSLAAEWLARMQEQVNDDLKQAEQGFLKDAAGADVEWRYAQDFPNSAMARAARAADLVIAGPREVVGHTQSIDPAELLLAIGRPLLIVPPEAAQLKASRIVVAWKDGREAQRAVADAMPFLQRADEVIVQGIFQSREHEEVVYATNDVAAALKRHGVIARTSVVNAKNDDVVDVLRRTAEAHGADLIVAGGYGHRRAREWLFGGVTRTLLHEPPCFVLFSH